MKIDIKKVPEIDLAKCSVCMGCIEVCREAFRLNPAGYMEVLELDVYPEDEINEAIAACPEDAIYWIEINKRAV